MIGGRNDIFIQHLIESLGGTLSSMWGFKINTVKTLVIISYAAISLVPTYASLIICVFHGESEFGFFEILIHEISHFLHAVKCFNPFLISQTDLTAGYQQKWNKCWKIPFLENDNSLSFRSQSCTSTMKQKTLSLAICRILSEVLKVVLFFYVCK